MAEKEKKTKEMDTSISIKLPKDLIEKARKKSKETGISVSFIARNAIAEWVKK